MQVQQIYELVNDVTHEVLGESTIVLEDLSNIVDIGKELFNSSAVDNYVRTLVDRIGKVIFVNRPYSGSAPSVLMDGWEYGSVLQKIQADLPVAVENKSWELENGVSYDPNVFYKPSVSNKFYNSKVTFEVDLSFTEMQVKESFTSPTQLNSFISMLETSVDKSLTLKTDGLIRSTINSMTARTINGTTPLSTNPRSVMLLSNYNTIYGQSLTEDKCLHDPDFIRYATYVMGLYIDRLKQMSTLFNEGGKARFTPENLLHVVLLSEFQNASEVYLESDTFHNKLVALPNAESVSYWQGSGTQYNFASTSSIDVAILESESSVEPTTVSTSGVLGVMFDRDALGVCNISRRVTTNYNPKAEFFTNFYKYDAGYFNDMNENFVVFLAK